MARRIPPSNSALFFCIPTLQIAIDAAWAMAMIAITIAIGKLSTTRQPKARYVACIFAGLEIAESTLPLPSYPLPQSSLTSPVHEQFGVGGD